MNSCGFQRGKLTNKKVTQLDYQIAMDSSSQCIASLLYFRCIVQFFAIFGLNLEREIFTQQYLPMFKNL